MEGLPKDVTAEMALNLSPPDLISFCSSGKFANRAVCDSEVFWRRKLEKDYPGEFLNFYRKGIPVENPKKLYMINFTFISKEIERFIPELIENVFGTSFRSYLTADYKEDFYDTLYYYFDHLSKIDYEDERFSDEEYKERLFRENFFSLIPEALFDDENRDKNPMLLIDNFIEELLFHNSINKGRKSLALHIKSKNKK